MPINDEIERYIAAVADLREENRKAHELLKDLRSERKRLTELRNDWVRTAYDELENKVGDQINKFLDGLPSRLKDIEAAIYNRFDSIMMLVLGEDPQSIRQGKRTVVELVKEFISTKKLPIRITEEAHFLMNFETHESEKVRMRKLAVKTGHDFAKIPVVTDSRVPNGMAYLVIPAAGPDDHGNVVEIDLRTGNNADTAMRLLLSYNEKLDAQIPAAFRKAEQ